MRHMYGQIELHRVLDSVDLIAVCDVNRSSAEHVAGVAEKGLGTRPAIYSDFDELLDKEKDLDAVDIVTDVGQHHVVALKAFEAGVHVAVEKPMAVTVRACRTMIEAAERTGCILSISENFRRDPITRLARAVLDSDELGGRRLMMDVSTWGTREMPHSTAWRHLKVRGGYLLDYGVHQTDLFIFFMDHAKRVFAETHLWEKFRKATDKPVSPAMAQFYGHRVREEVEKGDTVETTSEDMVSAAIRFESGALGNFAMSVAAPGERTNLGIIHSDQGSVQVPSSRSGRPLRVTMMDAEEPLSEADVLDLAPDFEIDDLTAPFFGGKRRFSSYRMTFEEIDAKLIAIELQDLVNAITTGSELYVPGSVGLDAVALVYAILESGHSSQSVSFQDVVQDRVNEYQREINEYAGL